MAMPQQTTTENRADELAAAVPANENVLKVVILPNVEEGFALVKREFANLKNAHLAEVPSSIAALENAINGYEQQIRDATIEAVRRGPDAEVEITSAPAVSVEINRDLQPGELVPGKGIFIGEFDLADARGKKLGIRTNWYDAALELGNPMTFNDTAKAVADHNENGRGGLHLDPARSEAELFEKLKTGEAIGKNVIAPLEVVKAIYKLRNTGEYKRLSDGDLPGKLITTASGTDNAHWQWSCTPDRNFPDYVRAVDFTDGHDGWHCRDNGRLSGRACFAELAL